MSILRFHLRLLMDANIRNEEDNTERYNVFVGDLSSEVNGEVLAKAFSAFGTLSDARVTRDPHSGKSYGYLTFGDKADAERAIDAMNGEKLGSSFIRLNWAISGGETLRPGSTGTFGAVPTPTNVQGGPVQQRRAHLHVSNLNPRITEYMLTNIFAVAGPVQHAKIIRDRNHLHGGLSYGFVEYLDMYAAVTALQTLDGRKIFDTEIHVNWADQGQRNEEDTTGCYHVFVGDLSPEVNDEVLAKAFSAFGTLSDAHVMWDNSGKPHGYGFLVFKDKTDAEQAIAIMNGGWLGPRAIHVSWANQIQGGAASSALAPINFQGGPLSYETVVQQTPGYNTTVYVGNLAPSCTQADLIPLFQSTGYLYKIRMQADRGFAFVELDTHEHAAMAIVQLQGQMVHGSPIKCSWGKDWADRETVQPAAMNPGPSLTTAPYGSIVSGVVFLLYLFSFASSFLFALARETTRNHLEDTGGRGTHAAGRGETETIRVDQTAMRSHTQETGGKRAQETKG